MADDAEKAVAAVAEAISSPPPTNMFTAKPRNKQRLPTMPSPAALDHNSQIFSTKQHTARPPPWANPGLPLRSIRLTLAL